MVVPEGQVGNKLPLVHVRAYCQTGTRLSIKHFSNGENTFCWVDPLDIGDRVSNDIRIMPRKYVIYHSGLQEAKQHLHDISFSAHLNVPLIRAIFILTSSTFSHEDLFALRDYSKYSCISAMCLNMYIYPAQCMISVFWNISQVDAKLIFDVYRGQYSYLSFWLTAVHNRHIGIFIGYQMHIIFVQGWWSWRAIFGMSTDHNLHAFWK